MSREVVILLGAIILVGMLVWWDNEPRQATTPAQAQGSATLCEVVRLVPDEELPKCAVLCAWDRYNRGYASMMEVPCSWERGTVEMRR